MKIGTIEILQSKTPPCEGLWTVYWRGKSVFGTTRPLGFFVGPKEKRFLICFLVGLRFHVGLMLPSGKTRLL